MALVQTVDVFTPSVDDPYTFGQISAANSVSDIYAMGGRPLTALSIMGFPVREAPDQVMQDILRGGLDKMAEANVAVIGGHSINDKEIKAGFAVTGLIDPGKIIANAGARPGDALILTKPLGTGILAFAAQIDRAPDGAVEAAGRAMASLNKTAAEFMIEFGAHACTDITGFGLMGHLGEISSSSKVDVEIIWDFLPFFPGVLECLAEGIIPGAVERNRESSFHRVAAGKGVEPAMLDVCFDAQTSGGLLIALPEAKARKLLSRLHGEGVTDATVIGKVLRSGSGRVFVRTNGSRTIPAIPMKASSKVVAVSAKSSEECCAKKEKEMSKCCPKGHSADSPAASSTGVSETQQKFSEFMTAANAPGALDAHTKQAIAIALSVLARCEPCAKAQIKKAQKMGFSQEEIDEAAWMAIAFGGSPLMMFYNSLRNG
jgi:selenide,water dikinase